MTTLVEFERFKIAQSQEGQYRLLVEAVTDYAIYMLDPAGHVASWNPGAQRCKGYAASEILGKHFSVFYTESDRADGLPALALGTAVRDGRFEGEGWRLRKDGSRFWAHAVINPVRDASGELVGFAKVTRDLTERKSAEARLRQSQDQFRLLVQGVTDYAIYLLDIDGRVATWNTGAARIKGYAPEEIVGRHFSVFYTEEDREKCEPERALAVAARSGRFEKEGWRVRKDGSRFLAHVVIDAIRDADGNVTGFAKVTRDVTEAKAAEAAVQRARDASLGSQKMEAIGQLTAGVAHDFNNILAAVLGGLEVVIARLPRDPNITPLLTSAQDAARRGASLTKRMLAFARSREEHLETIDALALAHGMRDLLQHTLGPIIELEMRFPEVLDPICVDANQLELAVLNLAINARDAMPNGGLVTFGALARNGDIGGATNSNRSRYVCLYLADGGTGMDEATLSRAADPFFSTKEVGKGTGLGLFMVQRFAEQSGGRLVLKSRKGAGSVAELWLPAADDLALAGRGAPPPH